MTIENIKSTVCDRTRRLLRLLLTEAIDAVRRPSPQAVVGNAHPTKKLSSTTFEHTPP